MTSSLAGVPTPDPVAWALTVVSQSPSAWSLTETVSLTVSELPSETETWNVSRVEVKPLQSLSCCVLRETEMSSSPSFCTMMSYSASSSVVASWAVGLAERATDTSAEAIGEAIEISRIATRTGVDLAWRIVTPRISPL